MSPYALFVYNVFIYENEGSLVGFEHRILHLARGQHACTVVCFFFSLTRSIPVGETRLSVLNDRDSSRWPEGSWAPGEGKASTLHSGEARPGRRVAGQWLQPACLPYARAR